MNEATAAKINLQDNVILCQGNWDLLGISRLPENLLGHLKLPADKQIIISGTEINNLDSAGSLILKNIIRALKKRGHTVKLDDFGSAHLKLMSYINDQLSSSSEMPDRIETYSGIRLIGKVSFDLWLQFKQWLAFLGETTLGFLNVIRHPSQLQWAYFLNVFQSSGLQALPIVGFLSLLIGIVLTYQIGTELRSYGANVYIVNMLGLSVVREFGPLITAIIVSGRTGAAFTAQLGIMKVSGEIDALRTMGFTPVKLLVLPRILALVCAMPLLVVWADIFANLGGMLISKNALGITYYNFLSRFANNISLSAFLSGLAKAPVFALIIASIGCYQGLQVGNSADSVGRQTTKSVVLAIFLTIVADAVFSVIYNWWNI